jgi:hypothetical protein
MLLEEIKNQPVDMWVKSLNAEFKQLAQKFQLSIQHPMSMPGIRRDGGWFGGGLGPYRRITDNEVMVSIDKRRIAFLKALAAKLAALQAAGHIVKIGNGISRQSVTADDAATIASALVTRMKPEKIRFGQYPIEAICWFVSAPSDASTDGYISFHFYLYSNEDTDKHGAQTHYARAAAIITEVPDQLVARTVNKLKKQKPTVEFIMDFIKMSGISAQKESNTTFDKLIELYREGHKVKASIYVNRPKTVAKYLKDYQVPFDKVKPIFEKFGLI